LERRVHIRTRRFHIDARTEIFASVHTDVTAEFQRQQMLLTALDIVPGFVFLKEYAADDKFRFRYVNKTLADALGVTHPSDAWGKCDADYLNNADEVEAFYRSDMAALERWPTGIRDETLTPVRSGSAPIRLATIKIPYPNLIYRRPCVLGIAVEITDMINVLQHVMNLSNEAIYVKDAEFRYIAANQAFVKQMLGAADNFGVIGKTFADFVETQIASGVKLRSSPEELRILADDVRAEDEAVLQGADPSEISARIRRTEFSSQHQYWQTTKALIPSDHYKHGHLLCISKNVYDVRSFAENLFRSVPQCMCLKNQAGEIVWCNLNYALRHGRPEVAPMIGLTDKDLSAHNIKQADSYRDVDLEVIRDAKLLEDMTLSEAQRQAASTRLDRRRVGFEEDQVDAHGNLSKLHTSKWPEKIGDDWHVAVSYSDITGIQVEVEKLHLSTMHAIKNAFEPIREGQQLLARYLKGGIRSTETLSDASTFLSIGITNVDFYLVHHLKFLHEMPDIKTLSFNNCARIAKEVVDDYHRMALGAYACVCEIVDDGTPFLSVSSDADFLRLILHELLFNSRKYVHERLDMERKAIMEVPRSQRREARSRVGAIHVRVGVEVLGPGDEPSIVISVSDDGLATISDMHRHGLEISWKNALEFRDGGNKQRGLPTACRMMRKLDGSIVLSGNREQTTFFLRLPQSRAG